LETSIISTILSHVPDNSIALVAVIVLYFIIDNKRKNTKVERDTTQDNFDKRITIVEHDVQFIKEQHQVFGSKLDKILEELTSIKVELAKKQDVKK
jgi:predicted transcriptional regulator